MTVALEEKTIYRLFLSADSAENLAGEVQDIAQAIKTLPEAEIAELIDQKQAADEQLSHRLALVAQGVEELKAQLGASDVLDKSVKVSGESPKIAFLFTGQGAQYTGMCQALYQSEPVFRNALDQCASAFSDHMAEPLLELLFDPEKGDLLNQTGNTQPALFAIEYALAQLWQSWGVMPDYVMGHSVGEYAAATIAGALSLADGARLIATRARLMQALPAGGGMAAVMADAQRVQQLLDERDDQSQPLEIATLNGVKQTVVSGDQQAIEAFCVALKAAGIKAKALVVSHAFHSALMTPMLDEFEQIADALDYQPLKTPLISNVTGKMLEVGQMNGHYWRDHVRQPVNFLGGMQTLFSKGCDLLIEIGPHPVLMGMGIRCVPEDAPAHLSDKKNWLASARRNQDAALTIAQSVARVYVTSAYVNGE
jgi:acyl transferase domain-containing protein